MLSVYKPNRCNMKRKTRSMVNRQVIKANTIVEAKYKLSVREQKLLLYMISQLNHEDDEFTDYTIHIKDVKELLNSKNTKWGNIYSEFRTIIYNLKSKPFSILENDKEHILNWLDDVTMVRNDGMIHFHFSKKLKPYLLQLKQNFTRYPLYNIITLKSSFSIRIYELLKQYETIGARKFSLPDLRTLLGIEKGSLKAYSNFKRLALLRPQEELMEKTRHCLYF